MTDGTDLLRHGASLGTLFLRACRRFPDREALVADGQRLTYAELADRVGRMGAVLRRLGIAHGSAVAILAHNHLDVLVVYLTSMTEGFRLTPLAALSSPSDHAFILEDAEIDALVLDPALAGGLQALRASAPRLGHILSLGGCDDAIDLCALTDAEPPSPPEPKASGGDIAMIYYTGGTTGRPKGVVLSHDGGIFPLLLSGAEWEWPSELRVLAATPISHAAGMLAYPTFLKGGTLHVMSGFSPKAFASYVARERITATMLVPTMIYRLLDDPDLDASDLASLQTVFYGAAPITVSRLIEALERFGPIFMQFYGQTEAPSCVAYLAKSQHRVDDPEALASCGVPLGPVEVGLLDDSGRAVEGGEVGEICVRGPLVMREYWRRPEETARALEGGWLHTGDMGRFDAAGRLHIVDRKKDMIISGGFNVYPSEIEAVLSHCPGVAACAVVGVPDPLWGEAVTAVIVAQAGAILDKDALTNAVRESKGAVHAPKRIVVVDALPLTAIGKIDKKALRAGLG